MYHNLRNVSQLQGLPLKIISLHHPPRTSMILKRPQLQGSTSRVLRALILIDNQVNKLHRRQLTIRVCLHLWNNNPRFTNSFSLLKISRSVINNNWMAVDTLHHIRIWWNKIVRRSRRSNSSKIELSWLNSTIIGLLCMDLWWDRMIRLQK
jgi:hypothetical protein